MQAKILILSDIHSIYGKVLSSNPKYRPHQTNKRQTKRTWQPANNNLLNAKMSSFIHQNTAFHLARSHLLQIAGTQAVT